MDSDRSRAKKTSWIVFFVLTWMLGTLVYGAFFSRNKYLKVLACLSGIFLLLQAVGFFYAVSHG